MPELTLGGCGRGQTLIHIDPRLAVQEGQGTQILLLEAMLFAALPPLDYSQLYSRLHRRISEQQIAAMAANRGEPGSPLVVLHAADGSLTALPQLTFTGPSDPHEDDETEPGLVDENGDGELPPGEPEDYRTPDE